MYASTLKGKLTSCRNSFFHLANLALYKSQLVTCPIKNAGIILLPWAACGGRGGGLVGFLFLSTCSRHIFSLFNLVDLSDHVTNFLPGMLERGIRICSNSSWRPLICSSSSPFLARCWPLISFRLAGSNRSSSLRRA
jgi:hypothetical protein